MHVRLFTCLLASLLACVLVLPCLAAFVFLFRYTVYFCLFIFMHPYQTDGNGAVGDNCGDCGTAYAACCIGFKAKGFPCTCDVK